VLPPSSFGIPALRTEDPRFLKGEGLYLENVPVEGALRAVFVRSMMPHARVLGVDFAEAIDMPGVAAVLTARDIDVAPRLPAGNVEGASGTLQRPFLREVLARDVVRFVGEPIAVVLAETLAQAEDAAEVVMADLDPLPHVTDVEKAAAGGAPLLWPEHGTNVALSFSSNWESDPLQGAEVFVRGRYVNQRLAPVPMETNAIAVVPESGGGYTAWVSSQIPFEVRDDLADALGVERSMMRVITPDVGGGFGAKLQVYAEHLVVAACARKLGRAVRWSESRSESMVALTHGRAQVHNFEIGARRDGTIVGLRDEILADMGAYPVGAFLPVTTQEMLSGVYAIPAIASRGFAVVTNATPVAPYRGAGRPEATALIERAMDMVAAELGMDPAELRRRNLIPSDAFPYTTACGTTYDVGDYEAALDLALDLSDYAGLRAEQATRRERRDPVCLGIGVSTYVEMTSFASKEFASVEVDSDGSVTVLTGTTPNGQGHETAFAQIVSGVLQVPMEAVHVVHSDTGVVPRGAGTWGSRSLQVGGSAIVERAGEVAQIAVKLAASLLEVDAGDVVAEGGAFRVRGAPVRSMSWKQVAAAAGPGELSASGTFRQAESTFPFGAHIAVVEVDTETGDVRLVSHLAVDDCGRILNPLLVEGQVHGGLAQGIAQALYEEVRYDEEGNPITANLTTYQMPSASEFPWFQSAHTQTPTPLNPLGAKGIGESATIGSTPAVQNAAVDALAHLGVRHIDLPLVPERVLAAIHGGSDRG
jgi:aerobic carbon-monoxide dehydrogenase large subunit